MHGRQPPRTAETIITPGRGDHKNDDVLLQEAREVYDRTSMTPSQLHRRYVERRDEWNRALERVDERALGQT